MRTRCAALVMSAMVVLFLVGCGKKKEESTTGPAAPPTEIKTSDVEAAVKDTVDQAKATMKESTETAEKAVAEAEVAADKAKADVEAQAKELQTKFDAIVTDAKGYIGEKSYEKALAKVQEGLQLENLTDDQKTVLQNLLDKIKGLMSQSVGDEAKKKLGGLLK